MTCDLREAASSQNVEHCCSTFVLEDGVCAKTPHAMPLTANGTGRQDALRPWCFSTARERLLRERSKWLNAIRLDPNRPYRNGRRREKGFPRIRHTSQHRWFYEWQGCFGCTKADDPSTCCSDRGQCIMGACACHDGTFGVDCRGNRNVKPEVEEQAGHGAHRSLAIFIYEAVPIDLGMQSFALRTWLADLRGGFEVYSTEWRFLDYLLRDTFVRTLDPESADLFFVPTLGSLGRMPASEGSHRCMQTAHIELIVHHLRTNYPYWDRSGGRDHVFFLTGDQGACGLGTTATKPIFITAWGLLGTARKMEAFEHFHEDFEDANAMKEALAAGEWCHSPHKDVSVPPYGDVQFTDAMESDDQGGFDHSLLHVGGIWGAGNHGTRKISFYSQGMRQALYIRFGDERGARYGFWIQNRSMQSQLLATKTKRSKFCLAPSGHGWGMRTGKNAVLGCVPLIAQPFVIQPYEMLLPYELFSRRVNFEDIPDVPKIVNISNEGVRALRHRLRRVRRAFVWRVEGGGQAYNHTILHLCHRAMELRGRLKAGPAADCKPLAAGLTDASSSQRMPRWFPPKLVEVTQQLQAERRAAMARMG